MDYNLIDISNTLGIPATLLFLIVIWTLAWKGLALWKSARKNQMIWFVVLLIVNTLGILEILYIFFFSKLKLEEKKIDERKTKTQLKRVKRR